MMSRRCGHVLGSSAGPWFRERCAETPRLCPVTADAGPRPAVQLQWQRTTASQWASPPQGPAGRAWAPSRTTPSTHPHTRLSKQVETIQPKVLGIPCTKPLESVSFPISLHLRGKS